LPRRRALSAQSLSAKPKTKPRTIRNTRIVGDVLESLLREEPRKIAQLNKRELALCYYPAKVWSRMRNRAGICPYRHPTLAMLRVVPVAKQVGGLGDSIEAAF
jgi:hypothetical protein